MDAGTQTLVRKRSGERCEYCHLSQAADPLLLFEIDHIIARKHGGGERPGNLSFSCFACNHHKGANVAGFDPVTCRLTRMFHPRRHKWGWHFKWDGAVLMGKTAIGRTTVAVLEINLSYRVELRKQLRAEGVSFD